MIAALFPGQGSQVVGMAQDFYNNSPAARDVLERAESALPGLLEIMWQGPKEKLVLTQNQQPALVATSAAAFAAYLESGGQTPVFAAGHSLGEYSAHVASGALAIEDAITLVNKRGKYMQEAVAEGVGAMAAILKSDNKTIEEVCASINGIVEIANYNSNAQTVISGEKLAVNEAVNALKEKGARAIPLKVSAPFHCSLMQSAADKLSKDLKQIEFKEADLKVISNLRAKPIDTADEIVMLLTKQVTASVRWLETIKYLEQQGVNEFIEFGSGKVLSGLVKRILKSAKAQSITDMTSLAEVMQ